MLGRIKDLQQGSDGNPFCQDGIPQGWIVPTERWGWSEYKVQNPIIQRLDVPLSMDFVNKKVQHENYIP